MKKNLGMMGEKITDQDLIVSFYILFAQWCGSAREHELLDSKTVLQRIPKYKIHLTLFDYSNCRRHCENHTIFEKMVALNGSQIS